MSSYDIDTNEAKENLAKKLAANAGQNHAPTLADKAFTAFLLLPSIAAVIAVFMAIFS